MRDRSGFETAARGCEILPPQPQCPLFDPHALHDERHEQDERQRRGDGRAGAAIPRQRSRQRRRCSSGGGDSGRARQSSGWRWAAPGPGMSTATRASPSPRYFNAFAAAKITKPAADAGETGTRSHASAIISRTPWIGQRRGEDVAGRLGRADCARRAMVRAERTGFGNHRNERDEDQRCEHGRDPRFTPRSNRRRSGWPVGGPAAPMTRHAPPFARTPAIRRARAVRD